VTKGRAIIILFAVILTGILLSGCIELNDSDRLSIAQVKHNKPVGEIYGSTTVGQTFISEHPNLSAIEIKIATYMRINTHDVIFHLRSASNSTIDIATSTVNATKIADNKYRRFRFPIATSTVNATKIADNKYRRFRFPPLIDSENKSYYFFIESPNSAPGNAITIWYNTEEDVYKAGSGYRNHEPMEGDLAFRIYHKMDMLNIVSHFIHRMQQDKTFFLFYFLLMGTIVYLIVKLHLEIRKGKK
jgi:hypothetical protein